MVAIYGEFFEQSSKVFKWKLQRICSLVGATIVGGVSKLSKFIQDDIGDFIFQVTLDTGGTLTSNSADVTPSFRYWWIKGKNYKTRNECQVSILRKNKDWISNDTEKKYMERNGYYRVYDSGIVTISTKKNNPNVILG